MTSKPVRAAAATTEQQTSSKRTVLTKGRPRTGPTARKIPIGHASPPAKQTMGAPAWKVTAAIRRKVENLVILGIDDVAIARYLGVHVDTLRKHCQAELDNALMTAGQEALGNLRRLGVKADKPNYYVLGNRFGKGNGISKHAWQETRAVEVAVADNRPDLSRASPEQLGVLRSAARVMQQLREPGQVIEHSGIAASNESEQDADHGDADS